MNRRERRIAARKPQTVSPTPDASTPAAQFYAAGLGHMRAKRYLEAQMLCAQALAADANHADSLNLMGLLSFHAKQHDHAVEWISRAIRQDPKPVYLSGLGTVLQQQGRYEEARKTFDMALQLKPDDAGLWENLGNVLACLDRRDEAVLALQHALEFNPRCCSATYKRGYLFYELERFEEALAHFDLCDELEPNAVLTLHMRAQALRGLKRFEESIAANLRVLELNPADAITCNNIGYALQALGRQKEAIEWFDRAIELNSDSALAMINKAFSLGELHRFDEAFAVYDFLQRSGANAQSDWNLSLLQLLTGNFEAGWAGREARWNVSSLQSVYPKFPQPMWLGEEAIEGKTVLVCNDEGFGDCIQFARYLPMLAARGARVILVVADTLYPLLSGMPGISQCLPLSVGSPPAFNMHCPMSSLPLAFRTTLDTIPSEISYLPPPAEARLRAWEDRLGPRHRLRVGLVWSGNSTHKNDHNRSLPLQTLTRICDVDASFVSLQKDPKADDLAFLRERTDIVDLTEHLTDFSETAALVSCLDLVITVDTSVAHLSAALGRPTWILLPYTPDYRWLLDRDDSPWYPTARLFRQTETCDYAMVLDRVRTELMTLVSGG